MTSAIADILHRMDQALYEFGSVTSSPPLNLLSHFKGQLYLGCATLLVNRAVQNQGVWRDTGWAPLLHGVEAIRCIGRHGLDINLTMKLAKTFENLSLESAKGQCGGENVRLLKERAGIYFNTSLFSIDGGSCEDLSEKLFQASGSAPEQGEMEKMKDAVLSFLACQKMQQGDSSKAISAGSSIFGKVESRVITKSNLSRIVSNPGEIVENKMDVPDRSNKVLGDTKVTVVKPEKPSKEQSRQSNYHCMLLNELSEALEDADCSLIAECGGETKVHSATLGGVWPWFDIILGLFLH